MAKAIAKFIRMSPRKLRRVINVIRGKSTGHAQTVLKFMPYAAARVIEKVLKSAVSNASQNEKLNPEELKVSKAYVDGSTTLRRWRAMSRGRGFPILKRTSHVTIEVAHDENIAHLSKSTMPKVDKKEKIEKLEDKKEKTEKVKKLKEKAKESKKAEKTEKKKGKEK